MAQQSLNNNVTFGEQRTKINDNFTELYTNKVDKETGKSLVLDTEIQKLSGISGQNTGDETIMSIQTKRPLKTINGNSLEGTGNVAITSDIFRGSINLSTPAPTLAGIYQPTVAGTYTNFGGLLYAPSEGVTYFSFNGTSFGKQTTPVPVASGAWDTGVDRYDLKTGFTPQVDVYLNASGTKITQAGVGWQTVEYIPVKPGDYIMYGNAYVLYDTNKVFLSGVSVPGNFGVLRTFTVTQNGFLSVSYRNTFEYTRVCLVSDMNKTQNDYINVSDIFNPIVEPCNVRIYGDSNTAGFGLTNTALSWAGRLKSKVDTMPTNTILSPYFFSIFSDLYNNSPKLMTTGKLILTAYTDVFTIAGEFIGVVKVEIDGVLQTDMTTASATYTLTEGLHTIVLTGFTGQNVINTITYKQFRSVTNVAVSGTSSSTLPKTPPSASTLFIVMYGTNDRSTPFGATLSSFADFLNGVNRAKKKAILISPIPPNVTGETNVAYVKTIADVISEIPKNNYVDVYAEVQAAYLMYKLHTTEIYSDNLHLNELGHKVLYSIIAPKLGLAADTSIF